MASLTDRIRAMSRRPRTLGRALPAAISLAMGEPDAGTPSVVVEAAIASLRRGRTHYSPITGLPGLQEEIAAHLSRTHGPPLQAANIVITHGGSAGLAASVLTLVSPGDRVLIPEPTYSLYADQVAMAGGEPVWIANRPDGSPEWQRIVASAARARVIMLCNPVNPTGYVFTRADREALTAVLRSNPSLYLVSDEAYSDIVFDGIEFVSALSLHNVLDRVVLSGTFSKSYAMTGWRLGFVCATADVADRINLVHGTINGPVNTFVQDAAVEALRIPHSQVRAISATYQRRRDLVMRCLGELARVTVVRPQGAFYAFPRIATSLSSEALVQRFAEGGVGVRAGSEFGPSGEGHVRLSFATDDQSLDEGLRRFVKVVGALPG